MNDDTGRSSESSTRRLSPEELLGPLNEVEKKFAPPFLFVRGPLELPLPKPRVAIVGTRKPSDSGLAAAGELARHLSKENAIVVSGLALGIDTAAHTSAISAGGRTIAVLGTPVDKVYPKENEALQQQIAADHLIVSQFPSDSPVRPGNFVVRNRTMALIADASVIVESGETGGSLHQGWEALRLGRPLFIWHTIVENASLRWPRTMIRYGAVELRDPTELVEVLPSSIVGQSIDAII